MFAVHPCKIFSFTQKNTYGGYLTDSFHAKNVIGAVNSKLSKAEREPNPMENVQQASKRTFLT
jgi:hypothetical protein